MSAASWPTLARQPWWLRLGALGFGALVTFGAFGALHGLSSQFSRGHLPPLPGEPEVVVFDVAPPPPSRPAPAPAAPASPSPEPPPEAPRAELVEEALTPAALPEFSAPALPTALSVPAWPGQVRGDGAGGADQHIAGQPVAPPPPLPEVTPPPPGEPLRAAAVDEPPRPVYRPAPVFPESAASKGQRGWVKARLVIEPDGTVSEVRIQSAQPAGVFDAAARRALSQWRFSPARHGGQAVRVWASQRLEFGL